MTKETKPDFYFLNHNISPARLRGGRSSYGFFHLSFSATAPWHPILKSQSTFWSRLTVKIPGSVSLATSSPRCGAPAKSRTPLSRKKNITRSLAHMKGEAEERGKKNIKKIVSKKEGGVIKLGDEYFPIYSSQPEISGVQKSWGVFCLAQASCEMNVAWIMMDVWACVCCVYLFFLGGIVCTRKVDFEGGGAEPLMESVRGNT